MKTIEQSPFELTEMEKYAFENDLNYKKLSNQKRYIILKHYHNELTRYALNREKLSADKFKDNVNEVLVAFGFKEIKTRQTVYNYISDYKSFRLID